MISVREAQQKILDAIAWRPSDEVSLKDAASRILAEAITAPFDSPPFDNSAMDGYAVRSADCAAAQASQPCSLAVTQTVAAGTQPTEVLATGEAARIFTGAMIPPGADTVIAQEDVTRQEDQISITQPLHLGRHIRRRGEELAKGSTVFPPQTPLTAAGIGLLASLGRYRVKVHSAPRIGIIVTGSEIVTDISEWQEGKIFDSNSFALSAALQELQLRPAFLRRAQDDKEILRKSITDGFAESDFLIITGGVSVGDYDFVKEIAQEQGVHEIFWKVRQKPGKPIYFGKRGDSQFLFGLPGNPASSLVCYYEYVRPALLKAMGHPHPFLPTIRVPVAEDYQKRGDRVHFLRGRIQNRNGTNEVEILQKQGSHVMNSFARANCLVRLSEEQESLAKGDEVEAHLLPALFLQNTEESS